ncbi:unnamed protein product [Caretta caretta]
MEWYHQKFWAARWMVGVWPRAYAQRLMDWATHWLRPETRTVGEMIDTLVLEQSLQSLPENICVWVRRHQPGTVEAAVRLTEEYIEAEGPRREDRPRKDKKSGKRLAEPFPGKGLERKGEPRRAPKRPAKLVCW